MWMECHLLPFAKVGHVQMRGGFNTLILAHYLFYFQIM